jgi:hypothetical protein
VPQERDKNANEKEMARRRRQELQHINYKIMVGHHERGFFSVINSDLADTNQLQSQTTTKFNGYDFTKKSKEAPTRPYQHLELPEHGFFQVGDVFWGFVSRPVREGSVPMELGQRLKPKPITNHLLVDIALSRFLSLLGQPNGLRSWRNLGGFLYPTARVLACVDGTIAPRLIPMGPAQAEEKPTVPKAASGEEKPTVPKAASGAENIERPSAGRRALPRTAVQQTPISDFNWTIQTDDNARRGRAERYESALKRRRAQISSKMLAIDPGWDSDDSDDSIDWRVGMRMPVGVRPRKRLRRDPDHPGPKSPTSTPFIYPYTSSDDDSAPDAKGNRVIDPSGEARKRRRRTQATELVHSQDMDRDVRILTTVVASGSIAFTEPVPAQGGGASVPRPDPAQGDDASVPRPDPAQGDDASIPPPDPAEGDGKLQTPDPKAASAPRPDPAQGDDAPVPQPDPAQGDDASIPPPDPAEGDGKLQTPDPKAASAPQSDPAQGDDAPVPQPDPAQGDGASVPQPDPAQGDGELQPAQPPPPPSSGQALSSKQDVSRGTFTAMRKAGKRLCPACGVNFRTLPYDVSSFLVAFCCS